MLITVVLCTHNRARYLRGAIESVYRQTLDPSKFELLVVDNRSTDETAAICAGFTASHGLRYIHEPRLGLCFARNTGWQAANGELVVFFDDDAIAEPRWLESVADAYAANPDAGVIGGPAIGIWEAERPAWLGDGLVCCLTVIDWGPVRKRIPDVRVEWLVGANMAVPKKILEEVGGFDPRLDRIGNNLLSGGDVYLQKEIIARGHACIYEPGMAIRHLASKERLRKPWFTRRYYWQGISDAVMELVEHNPGPLARLRSAALRSIRLFTKPGNIRLLLTDTDDPERFTHRCWALIELGHIAGLLGAAGR